MRSLLALLIAGLAACGSSGRGSAGSSTGGFPSSSPGSLTGPLAFRVARCSASSQKSGGGFTGGDNISIFLSGGTDARPCSSEGEAGLDILVLNVDGTLLAAATYPVHVYRESENGFAQVRYDRGATQEFGKEGTVTLASIDVAKLKAAGTLDVKMTDGTSLSGTFDTAGRCTP